MPFGDHLEELRKRLIFSILGVLPILIVAVTFSRKLLGLVIDPVEQALRNANLNAQLIQTSPVETFMTALKLAVVVTILVGSPWILFQAWLFIVPGLHRNERRFVYILLPLSAMLTTSAIVFLYNLLLPIVLAFFIAFGTSVSGPEIITAPVTKGTIFPAVPSLTADPETVAPGQLWYNNDRKELRLAVPGAEEGSVEVLAAPMTKSTGILQQYRVAEYTKMFLSLALAFSLGFQTPVVVLLLGWVGIIEPTNLLKFRKQVAMGCVVAGAILTPADPLSMLLLAGPLYILFEFGVILHRILPAERVSRGFGRTEPRAQATGSETQTKEGADAGDE